MKKSIIAVVTVLTLHCVLTNKAQGASIGVNLYGISYHFDRVSAERRGFNEFNEGLGLNVMAYEDRYNFLYLEAGRFKDTFENDATYFAAGWRYRPIRYLSFGLIIMHYNSRSIRGSIVAPIPTFSLDYKIASFKTVYLPEFRGVNQFESLGGFLTLRLIQL